jgi:hypothetical protein
VLLDKEKACRGIPLKPKYSLNGAPTFCCRYIGKFEVVRKRQLSHPLPVPAAKAGCPIQAVFWLEWDTTALDQWWWMDRASTTAVRTLAYR